MKRFALVFVLIAFVITAGGLLYGAKGYRDALAASDDLAARADALLAQEKGGDALGQGRLDHLIQVQDPGFYDHSGVDLKTAGAGITTITQSLSKRVAFEEFKPGIAKVRQTGYAMGLESRLNKDQILALFLETVEMGRGPEGWITGFGEASQQIYGKRIPDLSDEEYLSLLAVLIAPAAYDLRAPDPELAVRVGRIERLLSGACTPVDNGDVWLDGCA